MTRYLRWAYTVWIGIVVVAIVVQFYLAGYGVFAFNEALGQLRHLGVGDSFIPHFLVGDAIGLASLIGLGLAFAARVPWRITQINGAFVVLMVIQFFLAHVPVQVISALHVVNGVLIFGVTVYLFRECLKLARQENAAAEATGSTATPPAALKT